MSATMQPHAVNIMSQFCGQMQPHAAHWWQTPHPLGSTAITTQNQCAGFSGYHLTPAPPAEAAASDGGGNDG